MEAIFQVLNPNNTLTINRPLAHAIGLSEATVYTALIAKCSYYERTDKLDDGWFYSTVPDLEESTSLSEYQQKRCIANLVKSGLIESKNRGLPAKRSFRIIENIKLLNNLIAQGSAKCDCIKPNASLYNRRIIHSTNHYTFICCKQNIIRFSCHALMRNIHLRQAGTLRE